MAQYFALSTFLPPHVPNYKQHNVAHVFQSWLSAVVGRIWVGVIALVMLQRASLAANVWIRPAEMEGSHARLFYAVGLALSFAHLTVAKRMLGYENTMKDPRSSSLQSLDSLRKWLSVNNVRVWAIDVPMWLTTLAAVTELMALWMRDDHRVV